MKWLHFSVSKEETTISSIKDIFNKHKNKPFAKVIYLTLADSVSYTFHKPRTFTLNHTNGDKTYECIYTLDAAVLRDIERNHFSAYITCNGKQYGFDGESFSRMESFNWMSKLNLSSNRSSEKWRFAQQYETYFSFTKGYQILVYYLTSIKLI